MDRSRSPDSHRSRRLSVSSSVSARSDSPTPGPSGDGQGLYHGFYAGDFEKEGDGSSVNLSLPAQPQNMEFQVNDTIRMIETRCINGGQRARIWGDSMMQFLHVHERSVNLHVAKESLETLRVRLGRGEFLVSCSLVSASSIIKAHLVRLAATFQSCIRSYRQDQSSIQSNASHR